jgi:hypothetical protein
MGTVDFVFGPKKAHKMQNEIEMVTVVTPGTHAMMTHA